jgi:hypothetical protein
MPLLPEPADQELGDLRLILDDQVPDAHDFPPSQASSRQIPPIHKLSGRGKPGGGHRLEDGRAGRGGIPPTPRMRRRFPLGFRLVSLWAANILTSGRVDRRRNRVRPGQSGLQDEPKGGSP